MACQHHVEVEEGVRPCTRCRRSFCADCLVDIHGLPYCSECKGEELLDLRSGIASTRLPYATIRQRFIAFVVDWGLSGFILSKLFPQEPSSPESFTIGFGFSYSLSGLMYLVVTAVYIAYEAVMLTSSGQTVGKMLMNIRVVNSDGNPLSRKQAWNRALLRQVLIVTMGVDYLMAFSSEEKMTLHDRIAKTRVVLAPR